MYVLKFLLLIICFQVLSLQAQDNYILNGQIIDSTSQTPIPFAHIRLRETISISNQHGKFTLNYSVSDLNAEVTISCIGYKVRYVSIVDMLKSTNVIFLLPDITVLGEVVISELGLKLSLRKLKKMATKTIKPQSIQQIIHLTNGFFMKKLTV